MEKEVNNYRLWLRRILLTICAYLCVLTMAKIASLHDDPVVLWGGRYFGYNALPIVLFAVTIWLFDRFLRRKNRRQALFAGIGGAMLSVAVVYGAYAHYVNDIFRSVGETLQQFVMIIFLSMFTIPLFSELFVFLERAEQWYAKKAENVSDPKRPGVYFVCMWAIIFASYVPLFLAEWPGNFVFDAKYQIQNVIENNYSTHHPLLHTLMMGKAYELGKAWGDISSGYQLYTLIQMLILSSSFAYLMLYLYKKRIVRCIRIFVLLFFTVFPMHALFSVSATKDVLCAAFFLYVSIFLVRLLWDKEEFCWYSYVGMICSGVLMSLFRNNALYALIGAGIIVVLCIKGRKNKVRLLIVFGSAFLITKVVNQGLIEYTDAVIVDEYRESMSVPLQCLARICAYRGDEVPQELYDEICMYIRAEDIVRYNPYISDPVKNQASEEYLKTNFLNFSKLFVKAGLLFPGEYFESIITNTMGYWYPLNQGTYVAADIALYHTLIPVGEQVEKRSFFPLAQKAYMDLFSTLDYHYVPLLGYLFRNVLYVWLVIIYLLWTIYKKEKGCILVGMLPLIYLGTCLLGPVAALRYIYPLVVTAPLLILLIIASKATDSVREEKCLLTQENV